MLRLLEPRRPRRARESSAQLSAQTAALRERARAERDVFV